MPVRLVLKCSHDSTMLYEVNFSNYYNVRWVRRPVLVKPFARKLYNSGSNTRIIVEITLIYLWLVRFLYSFVSSS